jgi:addiction module HigA family antidote
MSKLIPITTPGEILREEFLSPLHITPYRLARAMGVPLPRVMAILNGTRAITTDTGLRLSRALGMSDTFWLNVQRDFEVAKALEHSAQHLDAVEALVPRSQPHRIPVLEDEALVLTASTIDSARQNARTAFTTGPGSVLFNEAPLPVTSKELFA